MRTKRESRITNIKKAALHRVTQTTWMLVLVGGIAVAAIAAAFLLPGAALHALAYGAVGITFVYAYAARTARRRFWQQFATSHGWTYHPTTDLDHEDALVFEKGHSQKIRNAVHGTAGDREARIFEYQFTVGSGKHKTTYHYTAFGFRFAGRFPHVFVNRRDSGYDASRNGTEIPVPSQFQQSFTILAPEQYEVEVLEIFTPDVFQHLLETDWPYDVELVDSELLIFRHERFNTLAELESEWQRARELAEYLGPKLDRAEFTPIGDYSHSL